MTASKGLHKAGTNGTSDQIPIQLAVVPSDGKIYGLWSWNIPSFYGVFHETFPLSIYPLQPIHYTYSDLSHDPMITSLKKHQKTASNFRLHPLILNALGDHLRRCFERSLFAVTLWHDPRVSFTSHHSWILHPILQLANIVHSYKLVNPVRYRSTNHKPNSYVSYKYTLHHLHLLLP